MNYNNRYQVKPALMSIKDSGSYLGGLCRASIYNFKSDLDWVKIGGRSFITVESLDRLIARGRVNATVAA